MICSDKHAGRPAPVRYNIISDRVRVLLLLLLYTRVLFIILCKTGSKTRIRKIFNRCINFYHFVPSYYSRNSV